MATLSGSLKATYAGGYYDKFNAASNWGEPVDPRHNDPTYMAPGARPPFGERASESVPPAITDFYNLATEPPYFPNPDLEPETHNTPNVPSAGIPERRANAFANAARSVARGEDTLARRADKVTHDATSTYASPRVPSLPPSNDQDAPGNARRALRGFNSLPLNNPGTPEGPENGNYTRQGLELYRWQNRRMPRRGLTHTKRALHLNVATTATDTPGYTQDDWTPYTSGYPFLGNMSVRTQTPYMRREPRPWDETAVQDGDTDNMADYPSWGL